VQMLAKRVEYLTGGAQLLPSSLSLNRKSEHNRVVEPRCAPRVAPSPVLGEAKSEWFGEQL